MGLAIGSETGRTGGGGTATGADLTDEAAGAAGAGGVAVGDGPVVGAETIRETFFEMNAVDFAFRAAPPPGS